MEFKGAEFVGEVEASENRAIGGKVKVGFGRSGGRRGRTVVGGAISVGKRDELFGVVAVVSGGANGGVTDMVVDVWGTGGTRIAKPGNLEGGGVVGEDGELVSVRMAFEIDQEMNVVRADGADRLGDRTRGEIDEAVGGLVDTMGVLTLIGGPKGKSVGGEGVVVEF